MDSINSIQGKLFYLARQMYTQNVINKKQQSIFKELIVSEAPCLMQTYEEYVSKGTELTLRSGLLHIIRKQNKNKSEGDENWESASSQSKKSSKKGPSMKIIIPAKNIQKLPAQMNRI